MKTSRRSCNKSTAQIGRGDGAPNFELVRPPEDNFFQLEVIQSRCARCAFKPQKVLYWLSMGISFS